MAEEITASESKAPFAASRRTASTVINRANDFMKSPLADIGFKGIVVIMGLIGALVMYAGQAKFQELIDKNQSVQDTKAALAAQVRQATEMKATLAEHATHLTLQDNANIQIGSALKDLAATTGRIETGLAVVVRKQEDNQSETREDIHRLDTAIAAVGKK